MTRRPVYACLEPGPERSEHCSEIAGNQQVPLSDLLVVLRMEIHYTGWTCAKEIFFWCKASLMMASQNSLVKRRTFSHFLKTTVHLNVFLAAWHSAESATCGGEKCSRYWRDLSRAYHQLLVQYLQIVWTAETSMQMPISCLAVLAAVSFLEQRLDLFSFQTDSHPQ